MADLNKPSLSGQAELVERAISSVVESAVLTFYGIVDMAPRSLRALFRREASHGKTRRSNGVRVFDSRISSSQSRS